MEVTLSQIMEKLKAITEELQLIESRIQNIKDFLSHSESSIEKIKEGTFEGLHYVSSKVNEMEKQIKELNSKVDRLLEGK